MKLSRILLTSLDFLGVFVFKLFTELQIRNVIHFYVFYRLRPFLKGIILILCIFNDHYFLNAMNTRKVQCVAIKMYQMDFFPCI